MGFERNQEGPVVLQLQRWDASQSHFDLSEFREAFISPTRKLLLLLSFHREAVLLPLARGESDDIDSEGFKHEDLQRMGLHSSTMPSTSSPPENTDSELGTDAGLVQESNCSQMNNCPFISDVNSLAWGICADTNKKHQEASFRELLFVCGSHGVTVHAFCQLHESNEALNSPLEEDKSNGNWLEWGPSIACDHMETSGSKATSCSTNGDKEGPYCCREKMSTHVVRNSSSRKWLRSFLTSVETKKQDGVIWTTFPDKSIYPHSAKVVSFHIFDDDSSFLGFLSHDSAVTSKGVEKGSVLDEPVGGFSNPAYVPSLEDDLSTDGNVAMNSGYRCFKIFSSNSYNLIGFALMQGNAATNSSDGPGYYDRNRIVLVSRLDICGMQWICSVMLRQDDENKAVDWIDFQFSDNLIVCLNASGLLLFYGAMTGEYVARLNILEMSGLKPRQCMQGQEKKIAESNTDLHTNAFKDEKIKCDKLVSETAGFADSRGFRKLLVAPYTSLLAAVDEHGAAYVICASDHVPELYHSLDRVPRQTFGLLSPWIVGNADISCQKVVQTNSTRPTSDDADITWKCFNNGHVGDEFSSFDNWGLHGRVSQSDFAEMYQERSRRFPQSRRSLHCRKLFLPTTVNAVDDMTCLSSFGITRLSRRISVEGTKCAYVSHADLHLETTLYGDAFISPGVKVDLKNQRENIIREAVGCIYHGCFYLVTVNGLSVVLPSVSISSHFHPIESIGYPSPKVCQQSAYEVGEIMKTKDTELILPPSKVEILDRVLLFEGSDGADLLCLENGWDLKVSRLRHLQLALGYLKFDEIEQSLEKLAAINKAEEGILRLIFAAVYMMYDRSGTDNEISAASRLLALATRFATKMIREYAALEHKTNKFEVEDNGAELCNLLPLVPYKEHGAKDYARKLDEMSHLLVITRNLQRQVASKFSRPVHRSVDDDEAPDFVLDSQMLNLAADVSPIGKIHQHAHAFSMLESGSVKLARIPADSFDAANHSDSETTDVAFAGQDRILRNQIFPVENPMEMIARWDLDKLDLENVVKDALLSGRLPLAVLKLHLHRTKDLADDKDPNDMFTEVRDVGRSIAYDLFMKGETGLAVTTLQKLGEDVEGCLRQLLFGTVNKLLRSLIIEEMRKYGYLRPYELAILDRLSLIERIYPSGSFWRTYLFRIKDEKGDSATVNLPTKNRFQLLHRDSFQNIALECGEVDGVVLGSWTDLNDNSSNSEDEDSSHSGYWASAAVWFNAWDQKTIDRILLDKPFVMGVHVMWESQLEYHICHNDWEEVSKLLDMTPTSLTPISSLQISLDGSQSSSSFSGMEVPGYLSYVYSHDELGAVYADIPNVRIFQSSAHSMCSTWLKMLLEKQLAKKLIFLKEYWDGTTEIISLLARSGSVGEKKKMVFQDKHALGSSDMGFIDLVGQSQQNTMQALHKLFIHHCSQHNLSHLLDLYLDHHELALDTESLGLVQDAAGDCQWTKWLLFSRIKGLEYDASLCNARTIISQGLAPRSNLTVLEVNDLIHTVDDIAENGWLMAALATLMFAPLPMENCLSSGSIKRRFSSSAQCTLENLRSALQRFPTLWRMLVAACLGNNMTYGFRGPTVRTVGSSGLSVYLSWRDNVFYSSDYDASLLQMLPCWFHKGLRRLIQLFVQGPLGWQALANLPAGEGYLQRDIEILINAGQYSEISAMSWEAAIQKQIEQELYASSMEATGLGLEHHLHRGRALAAFSHLLGYRVQKLKTESANGGQSVASLRWQVNNIHVDMQTLMAPLRQSEESLLSMIMPIAITNYQNSMLVASCAFLLELCGLSATMLRVDVAALRRISKFYSSNMKVDEQKRHVPKDSVLHAAVSEEGSIADSLARALADIYLQEENPNICRQEGSSTTTYCGNLSRALMLVLQHLEKASLPRLPDGMTCGSWLSSGRGDGSELRSQQRTASQHWNLIMVFCQLHQIPLSTKYLAFLARDNDWVGFLSEALIGGYPFDTVMQVAKKEFKDARLQTHILTVLRGMQSRRMSVSSQTSSSLQHRSDNFSVGEGIGVPVELFGILAECEKQRQPGKALLIKAKQLSWSMLAIIASCFPDVTPLSCLTVWLEITASRDASLVKASDIATQIANNVGAAVNGMNSLPANEQLATLYYNRKNLKRRRLFDPFSLSSGSVRSYSSDAKASVAEGTEERIAGEEVKETSNSDEWSISLPKMLSVLCEQQQFLPLLRAFEMFLPSCSLLSFIRALQAFSQMRLSEASAHLGSFSTRIEEEPTVPTVGTSWISSTASKAANAVLSNCPSPYEKRCLLQLLAATDFGDGGSAATYYRQQYWKINLAEPALRKNDDIQLGNNTLDDASLLSALEKNGHWEQARTWARQLEASGQQWKSAAHHVTESQAESMIAEWKEFLWDVPEERVALWGHCQTLFKRDSFPALQAGLFFLKHAEAVERDLPPRELHELLLLSLQWLSGMITLSPPVYPLHLLREIETRVWLLAVESEAQVKRERDLKLSSSSQEHMHAESSNIDKTANIISKMDSHLNAIKNRTSDKIDGKESNFMQLKSSQDFLKGSQAVDTGISTATSSMKSKRRAKAHGYPRRFAVDNIERTTDLEEGSTPFATFRSDLEDENVTAESSLSRWEDRIGPAELERAVLSLLEFGQISAAKQLQHKLSPRNVPLEFKFVDAALKLAELSTPPQITSLSLLDKDLCSVIQSYENLTEDQLVDTLQVLENLSLMITEGSGRGLCKRIVAVVKTANVLDISFSEAFEKQPTELLQLLSLKAQDSFEEAKLLIQTHSMPATSVARILAESFLKGLLAAHRGGYIDSQKDEGPAPLLWRFSDFLRWAELCPSEPEIGHALMRLVITGQEIPHACEVELLILSHHFYKSSACLDGVDVLVSLAATRVEAYVSEEDFSCLARLLTGVGNFHALNFILGILIENGQLGLLLQKFTAASGGNTSAGEAGFRMAVLTSLKHYNPNDHDAFAMVYKHFDMKHEAASLLEWRARQSSQGWELYRDRYQHEDLLESMCYYIEAAEVYSSIDAGNKTRTSCANASLVSLQIRMPDLQWLNLPERNARSTLVNQSRFQEALIVAEAYNLNQPSEWVPVLWNQMSKPELLEQFVAEFVAVLPLQPPMLVELAKIYRSEVVARGDQSHFTVWLTGGGGLPADGPRYLSRSFRCLLMRTRDLRLRVHLASLVTGFNDVIKVCNKELDKVPENAGPLVLRKGHGGAYLPLH